MNLEDKKIELISRKEMGETVLGGLKRKRWPILEYDWRLGNKNYPESFQFNTKNAEQEINDHHEKPKKSEEQDGVNIYHHRKSRE